MRPKLLWHRLFPCLLASIFGLAAVATLVHVLAADAQTLDSIGTANAGVTGESKAFTHSSRPDSAAQDVQLPARRTSAASVRSSTVGYGMNLRDPAHLESLFAPLGFAWVKLYEQYDALPTERLPYKVLYRIQLNGPPNNLNAWGDHVEAIAQDGRGLVEAYEIGNEPNQDWQWGYQVPDPDEYVRALKVAYARIKTVDPDAVVVSGGLGPVGRIQATPAGEDWPGNNGSSMDEWEYAHAMFARCASGCFDVFGYHPFGFAYAPETLASSVSNNFAFRGAEDLRQIMLAHGLGARPMWATEFGWIRDPDVDGFGWCKLRPEFNDYFGWMLVTELQQADYLSRAFAYADAHWPWMEAMFVWNLDWNDQGWDCDHIRFFSLFHVAGDRAPAYDTLMTMARGPIFSRCPLQVEPTRSIYLTDVEAPERITGTIDIFDPGGCESVSWTVSLASTNTLQLTAPITQGRLGQPLTYTIDSGAYVTDGTGTMLMYPTGTYTALLTFSTAPDDVAGSPQTVSIALVVTPELQRVYLPVAFKSY